MRPEYPMSDEALMAAIEKISAMLARTERGTAAAMLYGTQLERLFEVQYHRALASIVSLDSPPD